MCVKTAFLVVISAFYWQKLWGIKREVVQKEENFGQEDLSPNASELGKPKIYGIHVQPSRLRMGMSPALQHQEASPWGQLEVSACL